MKYVLKIPSSFLAIFGPRNLLTEVCLGRKQLWKILWPTIKGHLLFTVSRHPSSFGANVMGLKSVSANYITPRTLNQRAQTGVLYYGLDRPQLVKEDNLTSENGNNVHHYSDVIMSARASQIAGVLIVYSTVCSGADQRKHQSSVSLAFVRWIHSWPVNSPHKGPSWLALCEGNLLVTLGLL